MTIFEIIMSLLAVLIIPLTVYLIKVSYSLGIATNKIDSMVKKLDEFIDRSDKDNEKLSTLIKDNARQIAEIWQRLIGLETQHSINHKEK